MGDFASESDSEYTSYWRDWFLSSRGNEYFCDIDEEYLTDRFNLTALNTEVLYYQHALDLITDVFDTDCSDETREQIEKSARHLYGLVHARYIVTTRGLAKMLDKYKKGEFGKCPRVLCEAHPLLPMGLSDLPNVRAVKLYCARCEDIYNPKSSRHAAIDGAYFGISFHNILLQVFPGVMPRKSAQRYEPKVFGFRVHASAALMRWQEAKRSEMMDRLKKLNMDTGFSSDSDLPVTATTATTNNKNNNNNNATAANTTTNTTTTTTTNTNTTSYPKDLSEDSSEDMEQDSYQEIQP